MVAAAFTLVATNAKAQWISPVEGGRTTVTLSPAFLADLTTAKVTPSAAYPSQLYLDQIDFPISSGAISLETAKLQVLHTGGINLVAESRQIRLEELILTTYGEQAYISALVVADGRFFGRVNVFDVTLPGNTTSPLEPKNGEFLLGGLELHLDPAGASALNDVLGVKTFADNLYVGYAQSLIFVPLNAQVE
jgi:hypothetical protein